MPSRTAAARAWTIANTVFLTVFVIAAGVQYNDPDPLGWVLLYGAAAAVSALGVSGRLHHWWLPAIVGAAALVWATATAPRVIGQVPFLDMFGAFEMKSVGIEESREMYGLLLVAAWMLILSARVARRPRHSAAT